MCTDNRHLHQDQARQNMVLTVTDLPSDKLSHMMHAHFYLFPRKVVPHFYWSEDKTKIHVVLPTNEEVIFDAETKRIIGTDPKYPKLNAKPEVFPIFFSFEQLLSKEL